MKLHFTTTLIRVMGLFAILNISFLVSSPIEGHSQEEEYLSKYKCELVSNRINSLIREVNTKFSNYKKRQAIVKQEVEKAILYFQSHPEKKDSLITYRDKYLESLNTYEESYQSFLFYLAEFRDMSCQLNLPDHHSRVGVTREKVEGLNSKSLDLSNNTKMIIREIQK
jgi:hypothetical protein